MEHYTLGTTEQDVEFPIVLGSLRNFYEPHYGTVSDCLDLLIEHHRDFDNIHYYIRDDDGFITYPLTMDPEWEYNREAIVALRRVVLGL